ncbi:MAG TPA: cysteine desulfurase [Candidatus Acidoferrales bacterium]|nr:cysteine desulfurase [Candidatus Acidoferrales bacterium]
MSSVAKQQASASSAQCERSAWFDVERVREDFPILHQQVRGKPLVYLDNAATSQKPQAVIDAIRNYYERDNANIHRGVHFLSERATEDYERARRTVQHFVNAADSREIIFTRGTTESINLVAQTYGRKHVGAGDEILLTAMEHHSNIVPWQLLCEEKGAHLRVAPIGDRGELLVEQFEKLLGPRTKFVALPHVSNALGTVNPVAQLVEMAHRWNAPVLVDGAQAAPHAQIDVQALGCDFYAFSGHKVYGPTGIGILYGKAALLDAMPPYQGGGDMISSVTFEKTTYNKLPYKFEAGTPNVSGAIGLGAALEYVDRLGIAEIAAQEEEVLAYAMDAVSALPDIALIGTAPHKAGVVSFVMDGIHPHDIGTILDQEGIAVRTGHHCAQPVMQRFNIPATVRASFALYNTKQEVDALVRGIRKVREVFA